MTAPKLGAVQNWGTNSYTSGSKGIMAGPLSTTPGSSWPLATGHRQLATGNCSSGRSGLRPSLVRGDSPRNAPLMYAPRRVWGQCSRALTAAQRAAPNSANAGATVGEGLVPALRLSQEPPNSFATAGMNSTPNDSHPKSGQHPPSPILAVDCLLGMCYYMSYTDKTFPAPSAFARESRRETVQMSWLQRESTRCPADRCPSEPVYIRKRPIVRPTYGRGTP